MTNEPVYTAVVPDIVLKGLAPGETRSGIVIGSRPMMVNGDHVVIVKEVKEEVIVSRFQPETWVPNNPVTATYIVRLKLKLSYADNRALAGNVPWLTIPGLFSLPMTKCGCYRLDGTNVHVRMTVGLIISSEVYVICTTLLPLTYFIQKLDCANHATIKGAWERANGCGS